MDGTPFLLSLSKGVLKISRLPRPSAGRPDEAPDSPSPTKWERGVGGEGPRAQDSRSRSAATIAASRVRAEGTAGGRNALRQAQDERDLRLMPVSRSPSPAKWERGLGGEGPHAQDSRSRSAATIAGSATPEAARTTTSASGVSGVGSGFTSISGTPARAASIGKPAAG